MTTNEVGILLAGIMAALSFVYSRKWRNGALHFPRIAFPQFPRFAIVRTDNAPLPCNHLLHNGACVYCGDSFIANEDIKIEKIGKDTIFQASFASIAPEGKLSYVGESARNGKGKAFEIPAWLYEGEKLNAKESKQSPNNSAKLGKAQLLKSNDRVVLIHKLESPIAIGNIIKLGKKAQYEIIGIQINGKNVDSANAGDSVGVELSESASQFGANSINVYRI